MLYNNDTYKPQLSLRTFKDSTNIKNVIFTFDKNLKQENVKLNFDVRVLDEANDKYDVILIIDKDTYVVGKGITQTVNNVPYTTSHTTPVSKIADNLENPLDFTTDYFYYATQGTKRAYNFERGYGNPISSDGQRTLATDNGHWLVRGTPTHQYQRVIGDKRYELSNHLGNVLSVISDHKAISTQTGTISHEVSFHEDNISPWYALQQTHIELDRERGLRVLTRFNYDGIGADYQLEADKTYRLSFYIENYTGYPLEFGISLLDDKKLAELIEPNFRGMFEVKFTAEQTALYTLNLNVRAKEKEIKKGEFFIQKLKFRTLD